MEPLEPPRRLVVGELPPPRPPPPASRHTHATHTRDTRDDRDLAPAPRARHAEPGQRRAALSAHAARPPLDAAATAQQQGGGGGGGGGGGVVAPVVAVQTVDCSTARAPNVANRNYGRCVGAENRRCRNKPFELPLPSLSLGVVRSLETDPMHKNERRDDETDGVTGTTTTTSTARAPRAPASSFSIPRLVRRASDLRWWHIGTNSRTRSLRAHRGGGGSRL